MERAKAVKIANYNRQNRAELNNNREHFPKFWRNIGRKHGAKEDHMSRGADGQPFGNTLTYSDQKCFDKFFGKHISSLWAWVWLYFILLAFVREPFYKKFARDFGECAPPPPVLFINFLYYTPSEQFFQARMGIRGGYFQNSLTKKFACDKIYPTLGKVQEKPIFVPPCRQNGGQYVRKAHTILFRGITVSRRSRGLCRQKVPFPQIRC